MSDKVLDVILSCKAYYHLRPENICGGNLHIVLDDGNLEDECIQYCLKDARRANDIDGVLLAEKLLTCSFSERKKVYRNYEMYAL